MNSGSAGTPAPEEMALQREAERFLERDFVQVFAQMRHYDQKLLETFKFAMTLYTATAAVTAGLYQFSLKESMSAALSIVAVLTVAAAFGLILLALVVRVRVYFVQAVRYVNEHRGHFLARNPLGFLNVSGMYTDARYPAFFDWKSSHLWLTYALAFLNAVALSMALWIGLGPPWLRLTLAIGLLMFIGQTGLAVLYLRSREPGKSAEERI